MLGARVVGNGHLVKRIAAPVVADGIDPGASRDDHRRARPRADDRVVCTGGAVDEVPGAQRSFLAFDEQERLAGEDEEVLLVGLPVIHGHRLAGAQDEKCDAELRELRLTVSFEPADEAAWATVEPLGITPVHDEPTGAPRNDAVLCPLERSFWDAHARRLTEMERSLPVASRPRRPEWMKVRAPSADSRYFEVRNLIHGQSLHTICEEARCPNISECWGRGTATFQILGDTCTRACRYCYVNSGKPEHPPDPLEPLRLAQTAAQMGLKHIVVTSVDRDDVPDRGAGHYAATIRALKKKVPEASVEVLTPDFLGVEEEALRTVLAARPEVFNHNIETVRRLHRRMRGAKASYDKALWLLARAKELADYPVLTKSGIIVGLGETNDEVVETMRDLREHRVDVVTIGQYLQPSSKHTQIDRWVHPDEFRWFREQGEELGFGSVFSGPLVRSSYRADEQRHAAETGRGAVAY
jgi:lipoyl synthase